jgi:hypothetical protein
MFTIPQGTANYFANNVSGDAYYIFSGDLNQMGIIEDKLRNAGFNVCRTASGTYPGFPRNELEEYKRALKYVYDNHIEGWWNQLHYFLEHGICTQEEYNLHFNTSKW